LCGKAGWCQVAEDGLVMCRRAGALDRTDCSGAPFTLWRPQGQHSFGIRQALITPGKQQTQRAADDSLDRVYRAFLSRLSLCPAHQEALRRRGLSAEAVERNGYRTLPGKERVGIACQLADLFGGDLFTVPGFHLNHPPGRRAFPSIAGRGPGIIVPCRNVPGEVVALLVRADDPGGGPRYAWLSSKKRGGPGPGAPAHVPLGTPKKAETVRLTEGVLKADVAFHLSSVPTISVPGVGQWRRCLPLLLQIRPGTLLIAWDADWRTKVEVRRPLVEMARLLVRSGFQVGVEMWPDSQGKGIDDLLAAGGHPQVRWLKGGRP
jgi:hypothetical protein